MDYSELTFCCIGEEEWQRDLFINDLAALGFETFEDTASGFKAYIASASLDIVAVENVLLTLPENFQVSYTIRQIGPENWNAVWESNFEPIVIDKRCYVRATFHEAKPDFPYEIIIDPKMAFGTGHHQTTSLMMEYLLDAPVAGASLLDMGCGTGILAILAAKLGAKEVMAIDYDPVCYDSVKENIELNQVSFVKVRCGSKEAIPQDEYDFIFANINRNILLDQLADYSEVLKPDGQLFLSGFYDGDDLKQLVETANTLGLVFSDKKVKDNWVAARFKQTNKRQK
ncbi:50S ribosomal protein L11 methyltransferase [Olivibacter sp. XZL3]|uniref:50S ribosomal protein L11 methyltransferase n=1 Tax=Olivibacter sp. XZL3 TaxID=1735116 RepID=UPI00106541F0|nr:50S ribosomal protein L11 methyltransferase [Olivibacter sp. XZL3]